MEKTHKKLTLEFTNQLYDLLESVARTPSNKFTGNRRVDNRQSMLMKGAAENIITEAILQRVIDAYGVERGDIILKEHGIALSDYHMKLENGKVTLAPELWC